MSRHDAECTTNAVKERSRSIDISVTDTSMTGWKATKRLIYRGDFWEVIDKKSTVASEPKDAYEKKEEKEKEPASQVTTLCALLYFCNLTCFSLYGANYNSTF